MFKQFVTSTILLLTVLTALLSGSALASGPVFWEISKQEDIVKGDARGVSIAENGAITLAPAYTLVYDTKEAYIWSSAADAAGNIYLGTGHAGKVFKVEPNGTGRLLYSAPELDVTALATDPQGNVYAGTSPNGKIYKITPDGKESVFYDPPDKYIWSLAFDRATSTLYAGAGAKGRIYRIDASGKASVLINTSETNIISLAFDKNGNLIAGTDPSGLVLRISADGKAFALLDSPTQEIHSLSVAPDGSIFALGVNPQGGAQAKGNTVGTSSTSTLSSEGVITISTSDDQDSGASGVTADLSGLASPAPAQRASKAEGARSAVFRILPDGGSEVYWRGNDTVGFGLKPLKDGRVLLGTGSKGRIYQIAPDHTRVLLVQSPEDQTSTIFAVGDNLYATSSNLGRLYRIGQQAVNEGIYTSTVRDTKFGGQWGIVTWRASGNVTMQTRTGNTETPDATWSDWSAAYQNSGGEQITSPHARFIQWKATLHGQPVEGRPGATGQGIKPASSASLQAVTVAYLPRNQAPEITALAALPPGVALQEMPINIDPSIASSGLDPQLFGLVASVPPRRFYQKGVRSLTWQATDPNDDTLTYRILYRTVGDNDWHVLAENVAQPFYTIDGNKLPDGAYVFRVVASDAPSNPAGMALTSEQTTDAIEIDNTPPVIKVSGPSISGQTAEITFDAIDATSRIVKGEYSVDGGVWQLVYPIDGIADSPHETFKVRVTFEKPGEHVVAFRCADSNSNVGTSKATATVR